MTPGSELEKTLAATHYIDFDKEVVRNFAEEGAGSAKTPRDKAVALFYAVRDGIHYDPYHVSTDPAHLAASRVAEERVGYCVPKATLLAAAARYFGIPARVGFADVKNHLTTEKLKKRLGTDVFYHHGYTVLSLEGRWHKVTPTFNKSLCERFGVKTLEWSGEGDSMMHPFDAEGKKHMEYLSDWGAYDELPADELIRIWKEKYPRMFVSAKAGDAAEGGDEKWLDG
ncbi:MAG: hypothetical protein C0609_04290 [Deltaproteobacteria bacterium]|nr:MAG: hypothetical protein C0609_04290 [Deltaproteobacteria bacterium]